MGTTFIRPFAFPLSLIFFAFVMASLVAIKVVPAPLGLGASATGLCGFLCFGVQCVWKLKKNVSFFSLVKSLAVASCVLALFLSVVIVLKFFWKWPAGEEIYLISTLFCYGVLWPCYVCSKIPVNALEKIKKSMGKIHGTTLVLCALFGLAWGGLNLFKKGELNPGQHYFIRAKQTSPSPFVNLKGHNKLLFFDDHTRLSFAWQKENYHLSFRSDSIELKRASDEKQKIWRPMKWASEYAGAKLGKKGGDYFLPLAKLCQNLKLERLRLTICFRSLSYTVRQQKVEIHGYEGVVLVANQNTL